MNRKQTQLIGIVLGAGFAISSYSHILRKRKDRLAAKLLNMLNQKFNPDTAGLGAEKAFDIYYIESLKDQIRGNLLLLKSTAANRHAADIHSAWSWIDDNENKVYAVFRKLKDKAQVSQIAKAYQANYGANLIDQLNNRLNKKEIGKVLQIVGALPHYRTI